MIVHILHEPDKSTRHHLESLLEPGIVVRYGPLDKGQADIDVLVAGRPTVHELKASAGLKTLVIPFAGLPAGTREVLREIPSLRVFNLHHNAGPTAEMAVTLMMTAMKHILPIDAALRTGDWRARYQPRVSRMAEGSSVLVLGYGAVGQRVTRLCLALGMKPIIMARSKQKVVPPGCIYLPVSRLEEALRKSDVLMVCVPLTEETDGLLDEARLGLLPAHAVVVNVGRGAVIEEEALFHALESGRILAAGLDVWYHYPQRREERSHTFPSSFPFHHLSNVVMSPHMAGGVIDMELRRMEGLAELLNRLGKGESPEENRVDARRGY